MVASDAPALCCTGDILFLRFEICIGYSLLCLSFRVFISLCLRCKTIDDISNESPGVLSFVLFLIFCECSFSQFEVRGNLNRRQKLTLTKNECCCPNTEAKEFISYNREISVGVLLRLLKELQYSYIKV